MGRDDGDEGFDAWYGREAPRVAGGRIAATARQASTRMCTV